MKSEKEIRKKLKEIETDERLKAPCATIDINAPLALIQNYLEAQQQILKWILS